MKKKNLFIIILLGLSLLSVVLIFLKIKTNKTVRPLTQIAPKYTIRSDYSGSFPISLNIDKNLVQEISLPYLNVSKKIFEAGYVEEIAKNLNFKGKSQSFNDIDFGPVNFWPESDSSFFVYPKLEKIRYYLNSYRDSTNKQLTDAEIIKIASDFLIKNSILKEGSFNKTLISYWEKNPESEGFKATARDMAVLFRVDFSQAEADYGFLTPGNQQPLICIKILADGSVYSADITTFGLISKGETSFRLKNYDEIIKTIGDAKISSLSNYQLLLADLSSTAIKNVNINKISIAYLLETEKSTTLFPIYVLSGTANVEGYEKPFDAILYLPAISEN